MASKLKDYIRAVEQLVDFEHNEAFRRQWVVLHGHRLFQPVLSDRERATRRKKLFANVKTAQKAMFKSSGVRLKLMCEDLEDEIVKFQKRSAVDTEMKASVLITKLLDRVREQSPNKRRG
jgi:hypothetical protein